MGIYNAFGSGTLTNYGTLMNQGALTNLGGTVDNYGTLNSAYGTGAITNNATGTLVNEYGGTLNTGGSLTNSGTLTNYGTLNTGGSLANITAARSRTTAH